jgi:hypothetical protein
MSAPLSPSELHSLFAGLELSPPAANALSQDDSEFNRQWSADEFGPDGAQPLWAVEGLEAWQLEFSRRFQEALTQTYQPAWAARSKPGTTTRLQHFVAAHCGRQGFRLDNLIPETPVWIVFDPHIVATHLDLILGATESDASVNAAAVNGPIHLGALEVRLFQRCVSSLCRALPHSIEPSELRDDSMQILGAEETWISGVPFNLTTVLATLEFRLSLGEYSGDLTIALTREGLQSLIPSRALHSAAGRFQIQNVASTPKVITAQSLLRVVLARATLNASDFSGLQVGDIILTSQKCDAPCEVWVDGVPRFEASAVTFQDHRAVQITQELSN